MRPDDNPTADYRFFLANERTFLAWLRTGLALVGGGLAVAQFLSPGVVRTVLAVALLGLGATVAGWSVRRWVVVDRAIRQWRELPPSRFPVALAALVALGAGSLVVIVLAGAVGR
jgi:putative membrane protein